MKKVLVLFLILLFSMSTIFAQVNLKNGLIACYPFNANVNDESGNNNNGTVNGATLTTDRFGKANSAYNFNGSSLISVSPDQFKNQSYTYATWVKLNNLPSAGDNNAFITVGGAGGDQVLSVTSSYQLQTSNGFNVGGYNNANPIQSNNWTRVTPSLNKWYHVVCTRDNNSIKLYIDGQLIANNSTLTATSGTTPNYGSPMYVTFGARNGGASQYMQGSLDDIHLYNRPLTAIEVKALYDGNTPQSISITSNIPTPCGGDKVAFTANGATNTSKYQWKVDGLNQGINSNSFTYNSLNKSADYQVKLTVEVTDEDLCFPQKSVMAEKIISIKFCSVIVPNVGNKILIPNAFSPNGDGMNDTWEIFSIASNSDVIVEIYNRWGELIYYSKGYLEPWNGTYRDKPVLEGTYAYIVRMDSETVLRGTILVIR